MPLWSWACRRRGLPHPGRPGDRPGGPAAAPHQPEHRADAVRHPGPGTCPPPPCGEADALAREVATGHTRLRIGHAWSATGHHTAAFQRRWAAAHPEIELQLIRTNTSTGGLAEGVCDLAVVRGPFDSQRFASTVVGLERRVVAVAVDDPWARRRSISLDDTRGRTVRRRSPHGHHDARTVARRRPSVHEYTKDIDDWLAAITTGRCIGITPQSTATQYRREGIAFRPLRGAGPVPVNVVWSRRDPHPATAEAVALICELYAEGGGRQRTAARAAPNVRQRSR
ncbi:LysR family substrate-binding domain-containing protein [Streptomyces sp. NPDC046197]|uniref:LysR family substrate-binding domain-containing protein n=1 Tax=Streptomyces sp. NPDC046197 TaxID=3154337 RepID=UPI0033EDC575